MPTPLEDELAALQARAGLDRFTAVERLRAEHEAAARRALGLPREVDLVPAVRAVVERGAPPAGTAVTDLAAAEALQWEIGTWSSGAGEGLASMAEVRSLQLARAWLIAGHAPDTEVLALISAVVEDANRIAERHRPHADALRRRLGR